MKNQSPTKWILIGLMAMIAVLLLIVIVQLSKLNSRPNVNTTISPVAPIELTQDEPEVQVTAEQVADSIKAAETAAQTPKIMTSPDLKWQRMQGPVKTVKETKVTKEDYGDTQTEHSTFGFDREGRYKPEFPLNETYTRNKDGQVIKEVFVTSDQSGEYTHTMTYQYDDNGYVKYECILFKPDWGDTYTDYYNYTMNEKGWIVSAKVKSIGDGEFHARLTFTYSNIDEYGNWRKCVMKQRIQELDETVVVTKTRKITYWE